MKHIIERAQIYQALKAGIKKTGVVLPGDVKRALHQAIEKETGPAGKVLRFIAENLESAERENMPMCQDTGMVVAFVEMGDKVEIKDAFIDDIIHDAIADAYEEGYFRKSVVEDPLNGRKNTGNNLPAVIHHELKKGSDLKISLMLKGFGSENCSRLAMFKPTAGRDEVIESIAKIVVEAGGSPCPPTILGIGIGGTMDYAAKLSKKALIRELDDSHPDPYYAQLEDDILKRVNELGIGGGGLGGDITTLAVKVEKFPTHIAGLPVAVTVNCWADRKTIVELKGKDN
ncbi:fumarate hydratase [Spirochaeta isovalerica]|uniref:Fumarate hydratase subunit alpha n=1 Tax=Spirochaeta isovalerica TaxID=150 RepID=A0A841R3Z5_9SPIO|nr:fumarate hydratase [Spirochaeta isovalerica]MBB6479804.1 fumarate hydratase subunit alpha [Spirochaeta isovalerica]